MKRVGLFYHPSFSRRSYLTVGRRLADFPAALEAFLGREDVAFYECPAVEEELVLRVHTPELVRAVRQNPYCATAWHSAGGVVQAVEEVARGEILRAFAFIGAGGHHAGRDYFWGYCCFNDVILAVVNCRQRTGVKRFAIVDTDAHHGDGTRELCAGDPEILHVCFCDGDYVSADGTKVDVNAARRPPRGVSRDDHYLALVEREALPRVREFKPQMLVWYFGYDACKGDYGSLGLTPDLFPRLAALMCRMADEHAGGRLAVVLGGGSRTDLATYIIPRVIAELLK